MFQPRAKAEFVRRYCNPSNGWKVHVDIDASEEGRTGGRRLTDEAAKRQRAMVLDCAEARRLLRDLGAQVGGARRAWCEVNRVPLVDGDRDIVAWHSAKRRYIVAEVEGDSSGQPEQKLYKAIGQLVVAASCPVVSGWRRELVLVVHGQEIAAHLKKAQALKSLHISGLAIATKPDADQWLFRGQDGAEGL